MEVKSKTTQASETGFYIVDEYINHNSWLGHTENGHVICNFRLTDKNTCRIREIEVAKGMNLYFGNSGLATGEGGGGGMVAQGGKMCGKNILNKKMF
jgi:hypothetical protein